MAAADVAVDALEPPKPLSSIMMLCDRAHVYYDKRDKALVISERTKNPHNRLGKYGPSNIPTVPQNVNIVDVSETKGRWKKGDRLIHHRYFVYSRTVVNDIKAILAGVHTEKIGNRNYLPHKAIFRLRR